MSQIIPGRLRSSDPARQQEPEGVHPSAPSAPIPRRSGGAAAGAAPQPTDPLQRATTPGLTQGMLATVPAWVVSLLVHLIAFIALALIVTG